MLQMQHSIFIRDERLAWDFFSIAYLYENCARRIYDGLNSLDYRVPSLKASGKSRSRLSLTRVALRLGRKAAGDTLGEVA